MNILMMSKLFTQSGVGTHIRDLSTQFASMGHTVHIISSTNDWGSFCEETGIHFQYIDFSFSPKKLLNNLKHISLYIRTHEINVVHCHHRTCGIYMHLLSRMLHVPFVWSNHLDDIPSSFLYRKLTFYGRKVICVSTELKRFCVEKLQIPENDVEVVVHGIDPSKYYFDEEYVNAFKSQYGISNEKIIGLFARMAPIKGHSCLIDAVAKLPVEKREKIKVVFFGGTKGEYAEQLREELRKRGMEGQFLFEDFVTASEALSLSDITVLPSLKEGFGIVSIESYLMRKPHIRTTTAGYHDIGDGCIGISIGDSDSLSRELEAFIDGKDYAELVDRAYQIFQEKCTMEKMAERILHIYREICEQL